LRGAEHDVCVPAELLSTPGTPKDRAEESIFNLVDPEPEWLTHSRPGKAMAFTKERPEIKRVWSERISLQQRAIAEMEAREPAVAPSNADLTEEVKAEAGRLGVRHRRHHPLPPNLRLLELPKAGPLPNVDRARNRAPAC
jgi:hypothetical protein